MVGIENSAPLPTRCAGHPPPQRGGRAFCVAYRIVGIENSAPLLMPEGQRCVTVLVVV